MGMIVKKGMRKLGKLMIRRSTSLERVGIDEGSLILVKGVLGAAPEASKTPKGYVGVYVGRQEMMIVRYVIPVKYFSSPKFAPLMEMTREEFGFDQAGGLRIPCDVDEFERVLNVVHGCSCRKS